MQCPTCLDELPKRFFRPSQWYGFSVVTDEFFQCKICDGILRRPEWWSNSRSTSHSSRTSSSAMRQRALTVRPMPETGLDHVPKEALELIELLVDFKSEFSSTFVYKWMELPRLVRKDFSYNGAVRCRGSTDPVHYHCRIGNQNYFDPSNWVYAVAMRLMMPRMMNEVQWNDETKGDIFESILGCHYLVANGLMSDDVGSLKKHSGIVSAIFEAFAWHTWQLCVAIGNDSTDEALRWVTWIIDVVAYRQMRDKDIGLIIMHEKPVEFEARCKSKGHLVQALV